MKIIGKTGGGYIVETTTDEIANALGFTNRYGADWTAFIGKHVAAFDSRGDLRIGAQVDVAAAHSFFSLLQHREKQARDAAGLLRSLADMVDNSLPTLIVAPLDSAEAQP